MECNGLILPQMKKINYIVSIHGNIGAGKTTFKKLFMEITPWDHIGVDEPVNYWVKPISDECQTTPLQAFYSDKERNGFTFQVIAFTSRMKNFAEVAPRCLQGTVLVSERSMLSDNMFFMNLMKKRDMSKPENALQMKAYKDFFRLICTTTNTIERVIIYIKTSPEECLRRIRKRGRKEEEGITLEDLRELQRGHEEMLKQFDGLIIEVDWPEAPEAEMRELAQIVKDEYMEIYNDY